MSVGLGVEELAELLNVDEVSIDAHAKAKWSVHFEGQLMINRQRGSFVEYRKRAALRICDVGHGQQMRKNFESTQGVTYAEELPAVGYLRWPMPRFPGNC